jgi:hypothetical protein
MTDNDNYDDNDYDEELKRRVDISLSPTGYGTWTDKKVK